MSTRTAPSGTARTSPKGGWHEEVLDRTGRIRDELLQLPATDPRVASATRHIDDAEVLVGDHTTPGQWWSGGRVEAAWRELRLAEEVLLDVGTPVEVASRVVDAATHAGYYLGPDDPRTQRLKTLLANGAPLADLVPAAHIALAASHQASDRDHRQRRSFINTLRATSALLVVLAALLVLAVQVWDLTLLPTVDGLTPVAVLSIAVLFGAQGALFSAIPSIAQMPSREETFSTVRIQAVLKVVIGAWSAVIGLMAVSAGLGTTSATTVATSAADAGAGADMRTLAGFAMVAALFGASQEALTRFADHKAAGLSSGPSRTTPKPPGPSAPPTTPEAR